MTNALTHLNYVAVLVVAAVGFLFGWLWYSPVLFAKAWMAEMNISPEQMNSDAAKSGMAGLLVKGFLFTFLSTLGLAALVRAVGTPNWMTGAKFGAFVGVMMPGMRMLNTAVWEKRSAKLQAITIGHEVILYTIQGAILGMWR